MELQVQKFLRNDGTLQDLADKYAIKSVQHKEFPELYLLKYNQIDSNFTEKIVRECRGIILNSQDNWNIVCMSYEKFFNHGEGHADEIDWSTARVQEKVDGSLCQLYWYKGEWRVATSGTPDASGEVQGFNFTFKELFWKTWKELNYSLPDVGEYGDQDICWAFELMTPYNKIIVQHIKSHIVLHGARYLPTLKELDPIKQNGYNWEIVKEYKLSSFDEILEVCKILDPTVQEGYVVVDNNFNRVKIKTPQYVALSHMKEGMGIRRMLELVRSTEESEFLSYFPEFNNLYLFIKDKYEALVNSLEIAYSSIKDIVDQKEFALRAVKFQCSSALFAHRKNPETSIKQHLANMNIKSLIDILKLKEEESHEEEI